MKKGPRLLLSSRFEIAPNIVACPKCGEHLPGEAVHEAWVEVPVQPGWRAAYRVAMRRGRPVVAEVRVLPEEDAPGTPGRWSEDPNAVPAEGVPGLALRKLRVSNAIGLFEEFVHRWEANYGSATTKQVFGRFGFGPKALAAAKHPGRGGRPDEFYLHWAEAYVERLRAGSRRPVKDLAAHPAVEITGFDSLDAPRAEAAVRAIIHEARRRGFLTGSTAGLASGELTERALALLADAADPGQVS